MACWFLVGVGPPSDEAADGARAHRSANPDLMAASSGEGMQRFRIGAAWPVKIGPVGRRGVRPQAYGETDDEPNMAADDYFEHDADVGVIGRGPTLERAFEAAANATWAIMADPASVGTTASVRVTFVEPDLELALVTWLNALLSAARVEGLVLARFSLTHEGREWRGEAWGEPWRDDLERGVEVKGATLTALSVTETPHGWEARCVVDV